MKKYSYMVAITYTITQIGQRPLNLSFKPDDDN